VSAIALAVVAIGLLVAALRGRSAQLIGAGVFLSLITLALTVTGLSGTQGYGEQRWTPTSVSEVQPMYTLNGGEGVLDLTGVSVPAGQVLEVDVDVKAGHAAVILPADTNFDATCTANVGRVECLDEADSGWNNDQTAVRDDVTDRGTIDLDVHVGAGFAEVSHG
jgi:predicted membrane protein